jgi:polysaccharide biosynthesis/export protein
MRRLRQAIAVLLIIFFAGSVFAQQIAPAVPGYQSPSGQQSFQGLTPQQIQQPQPVQQTQPQQSAVARQPSQEKPSVFEMYVSDRPVEITEKQFEIIKKFEGITFSYTSRITNIGNIAVPVKIVKSLEKLEGISIPALADIDAGYLIGTPDAIFSAFRIFGITTGFDVSTSVRQFGYELFRQPPSTFAPVDRVPVGPDYVIGPGDEIRVTIWGNIEGQFNLVVDRDGHISLPKVGILGVTGLTFKELKELLHKEFSKYYTGFEMNVSMGALRTIRVYIVGNAEKPGSYTISSLSTLVNALLEAGGPSKKGTMRNIQLKRNGRTVVNFDMYDLLLKGDKTKDIRLMPEDVIFIPPVGPLVAIAGNVKNPAIYELRGESKFNDLVEMAGGFTATAFKGRIQVQRIENHSFKTVFEGDFIDIEKNLEKNFTLKDGDLVKIFSILETKNTVTVTGAVANAGEYGIAPGVTRIKDVIALSGGLVSYASNQAELTRLKVTQSGPQTERFNIDISKAMAGDAEHNIPFEINDYLFVRAVPEWQTNYKVNVQGEVKFPGTYTVKKGERLSSLIERAGGYTERAHLRGAVFMRERVRELQQKNLEEMITRLERELFSVGVAQASVIASQEEAQAKKLETEQKQRFIESLRKLRATGRLSMRLAHLRLLKGSEYDIELEDGDNLYIPVANNVVNVTGSVMSHGSFIYSDNLDYKDYIEMSGGYSRYADQDNIYVLKVDGSAMKPRGGFISWSPFRSRWEMTAFGEAIKGIEPGDTIVVPEKIERIAWLREIKDITQILANVALTVGVFKALY